MSMSSWARREVEIFKGNKESNDEFDYIGACCDSALKAFQSLMNDGHSGMSIGITTSILNKLIKGQPLTPIEDTDDVWNKSYEDKDGNGKYTCYQNKRMSALFKTVYEDGTVSYSDVNRVRGINLTYSNSSFHSGRTDKYVNDRFPITMPYVPPTKPYEVYTEDFLSDPANSRYTDWDVEAYYYILTPEGDKIELNEFYYYPNPKENERVQITKEKYEELKKSDSI